MFNEQKSSADYNNLQDMTIHFIQTLATSQLENVLTFLLRSCSYLSHQHMAVLSSSDIYP
jgi:hypothetical protein